MTLLKPEGCTCPSWFVLEGCPAPEHAALVGKGAVSREDYDRLRRHRPSLVGLAWGYNMDGRPNSRPLPDPSLQG